MASDASRIVVPATAPLPDLPDELWEDIFLRLDDVADLARACASCTSFRRVITARPFLRRFRSLHVTPVLGFINSDGFHLAEPPHRSARAARALTLAADFTFSFLPERRWRWFISDARDGLVLLTCKRATGTDQDLVVCDPVRRRYVHVPAIPDGLASSVPPKKHSGRFIPFLGPALDAGEERWPPLFSVICTATSGSACMQTNKAVAFVFSSGDGKWLCITYQSSRIVPHGLLGHQGRAQRSYAHGCFFWMVDPSKPYWMVDYSKPYSLVLDVREMKFSIIDLPPKLTNGSHCAIVEAGEGMLGLLTINQSTVELCRRIWPNNGGVDEESCWQPYKTASLPKDSNGKDYGWSSTGAANEAYILMVRRELKSSSYECSVQYHTYGRPSVGQVYEALMVRRELESSSSERSVQYHTLELKTLVLERLRVSDHRALYNHIYARFPPLLTPSSI